MVLWRGSKKIMIGAVLLSAAVLLKAFNLGQYLTPYSIKSSQENFALLYADNQPVIILVYTELKKSCISTETATRITDRNKRIIQSLIFFTVTFSSIDLSLIYLILCITYE